jgi:hypothetical protein
MKNIVRCAVKNTSNLAAAVLLQRIIHWSKYMRIWQGGKLWIVKSAKEWCADTGLSFKQYNTAIASLRDDGLVITESHLFNNKSCTHTRITPKLITILGAPDDPGADGVDDPISDKLIYTLETTLKSTQELASPPKMQKEPSGKKEFSGEEESENLMHAYQHIPVSAYTHEEPEMAHKVSDVIQGKLAPKPGSQVKPVVQHCIYEWRERCGEVTGKFQTGFTAKQAGQMKMFVNGAPPGVDPKELIRNVVKDWFSFMDEVKEAKGFKSVPAEPAFDFFFVHRQIAYNFKPHTGKMVPLVKGEQEAPVIPSGIKMFKPKV